MQRGQGWRWCWGRGRGGGRGRGRGGGSAGAGAGNGKARHRDGTRALQPQAAAPEQVPHTTSHRPPAHQHQHQPAAQPAHLDVQALGHKEVGALEVAVDDGGLVRVQVQHAARRLTRHLQPLEPRELLRDAGVLPRLQGARAAAPGRRAARQRAPAALAGWRTAAPGAQRQADGLKGRRKGRRARPHPRQHVVQRAQRAVLCDHTGRLGAQACGRRQEGRWLSLPRARWLAAGSLLSGGCPALPARLRPPAGAAGGGAGPGPGAHP